ncbi:hypothetical protein [Nocardioides campestrisoli]|uniref:hypothetical protein n=1 Tax=Nocardioides campestrisoli TaxID=2736757 RepID=UPI00163D98BE|nr:hypothetical protein [Nocardioides campestrisoli]
MPSIAHMEMLIPSGAAGIADEERRQEKATLSRGMVDDYLAGSVIALHDFSCAMQQVPRPVDATQGRP